MRNYTVTYEEWSQTFFHPLMPMGVYYPKEETFSSFAEAQGFAKGLENNPRIRFILVR